MRLRRERITARAEPGKLRRAGLVHGDAERRRRLVHIARLVLRRDDELVLALFKGVSLRQGLARIHALPARLDGVFHPVLAGPVERHLHAALLVHHTTERAEDDARSRGIEVEAALRHCEELARGIRCRHAVIMRAVSEAAVIAVRAGLDGGDAARHRLAIHRQRVARCGIALPAELGGHLAPARLAELRLAKSELRRGEGVSLGGLLVARPVRCGNLVAVLATLERRFVRVAHAAIRTRRDNGVLHGLAVHLDGVGHPVRVRAVPAEGCHTVRRHAVAELTEHRLRAVEARRARLGSCRVARLVAGDDVVILRLVRRQSELVARLLRQVDFFITEHERVRAAALALPGECGRHRAVPALLRLVAVERQGGRGGIEAELALHRLAVARRIGRGDRVAVLAIRQHKHGRGRRAAIGRLRVLVQRDGVDEPVLMPAPAEGGGHLALARLGKFRGRELERGRRRVKAEAARQRRSAALGGGHRELIDMFLALERARPVQLALLVPDNHLAIDREGVAGPFLALPGETGLHLALAAREHRRTRQPQARRLAHEEGSTLHPGRGIAHGIDRAHAPLVAGIARREPGELVARLRQRGGRVLRRPMQAVAQLVGHAAGIRHGRPAQAGPLPHDRYRQPRRQSGRGDVATQRILIHHHIARRIRCGGAVAVDTLAQHEGDAAFCRGRVALAIDFQRQSRRRIRAEQHEGDAHALPAQRLDALHVNFGRCTL